MASAQAEMLKDLYKGWVARMGANPEMGLDEMRDLFEEWHLPTAEPEGVTYAEVDAGGVPAIWCSPVGCDESRVIFYTHGGGYVVGSMHTHRKLGGHLAKAAGCRALVIDYRRAPEHPHPQPVEDAVRAYRWLLDQGIEAGHIVTCGDSAGGGMCTTMVLQARDEGLPLPAGIMPLSPWYDMEGKGDSIDGNASVDVLVQREILMGMATTFLGEASPADPLANPLYADLAGLPPVLIQVGGDEALLDDSHRFAARAEEAGVDVSVEVYPEMQHVFQFLAGRAPEADDAVAKLGAWAKARMGG